MGLRPTHGDESALLRFIDSKEVTRDFRGSVIAGTRKAFDGPNVYTRVSVGRMMETYNRAHPHAKIPALNGGDPRASPVPVLYLP
jgi:hypothetical protein